MATVTLGPGNNYYEILDGDRDQNVNGNNGIDIIIGSSLDNRIHGNHSNDELYGMGGDDNLKGHQGDDLLDGGDGDDLLEGGADNDQLTGGNDADTFNYSFTVQEDGSAGWMLIDTDTISFTNGVNNGVFNSSYGAFVNSIVTDVDGDGTVEWTKDPNNAAGALTIYEDVPLAPQVGDIKYESADTTQLTVHNGQIRYYDATINTYEWQEAGTSVESEDGHDTITDFEWGTDVLNFSGITQTQFETLFIVTQIDVGSDGVMDTVIAIDGFSDWSVTLVGITKTEADFVNDGAILFGA